MTKQIVQQQVTDTQPLHIGYEGRIAFSGGVAFSWGKADAMTGYSRCNPFRIGSTSSNLYDAGFDAGKKVRPGDPVLLAWGADGAPTGDFYWTGEFDVVADCDRCDYVGA